MPTMVSKNGRPPKGKKEPAVAAKVSVGAVPGSSLDIEKKIRNISKKLEQIEELKQKLSTGAQLELTQISKIESQGKWEAEVKID